MIMPIVTQLGGDPTAHPLGKSCGHTRHVGPCPVCQRAARMRSQAQLAAAVTAGQTWATRALRFSAGSDGAGQEGGNA
jgi:hypothetical protein